jgi:quinohemoprotein amine dehydrogenase
MQRVSFARATPEGWQAVLKSMLRSYHLSMTPAEARDIVKYLSDTHGLAPEESKPVMYEAERRVHDEAASANETLFNACGQCHSLGRVLTWRRSPEEWKEFTSAHAAQYKIKVTDDVLKLLTSAAPLDSAEWRSWAARLHTPELSGRWLVTAHVQGKGKFCGEMIVTPVGNPGDNPGEFTTHVKLRPVRDKDAPVMERTGRIAVYAGYEWRGRSAGTGDAEAGPYNLSSDAREAMWISPDGTTAQGRWFWGQYQEFGFDVSMRRASGSTLLAVDVSSLKTGSEGNLIRLIGDHFPDQVTVSDIGVGPGVTVGRIVAHSPTEIAAELDVSSGATPGRRDISVGSARLSDAIAIYDRIDYIRVMPDAAMAAFPNETHPRGYQQFEAIAYQRGLDGRLHTADDLELGPVDAVWSMEVFYETDSSRHEVVGSISQTGFFTPAAKNPGVNYDIWIIAAAKGTAGKSYVVVTVPTYEFEGRSYVRDLDRWIEEP